MARDKVNLDVFWLKDEPLSDSDNLTVSEVIAQEIINDMDAAPEQFWEILGGMGGGECVSHSTN